MKMGKHSTFNIQRRTPNKPELCDGCCLEGWKLNVERSMFRFRENQR